MRKAKLVTLSALMLLSTSAAYATCSDVGPCTNPGPVYPGASTGNGAYGGVGKRQDDDTHYINRGAGGKADYKRGGIEGPSYNGYTPGFGGRIDYKPANSRRDDDTPRPRMGRCQGNLAGACGGSAW